MYIVYNIIYNVYTIHYFVWQRDREKEQRKLIEEKEKTLLEQTESAKLSSFTDLIPPEPESYLPSKIFDKIIVTF